MIELHYPWVQPSLDPDACKAVPDGEDVLPRAPGCRLSSLVCLRFVATAACAMAATSVRRPRRMPCRAVSGATRLKCSEPKLRVRCAVAHATCLVSALFGDVYGNS